MKTLYKTGDIIDYTAGSAISSGDVLSIGNLVGIAIDDIANGDTGPALIRGAVRFWGTG